MDRGNSRLWWKVLAIPAGVLLVIVVSSSLLFQSLYLNPSLANRGSFRSIIESLYGVVILASLVLVLRIVVARYRRFYGKPMATITRAAVIALGILSLLGCTIFLGNIILILVSGQSN